MPDLLTDFTRYNADWLRRITVNGLAVSAEEWSNLAYICEFLSRVNSRFRDYIRSDLNRGVEASKLQGRLEQNLAAVDDSILTMERLEKGAENASRDIQDAGSRIRSAKVEAKAVQAELASILALVKTEPPPVPEDILAAAEAGTFIRLDEFSQRR